ncbi:MAG: hypothetical protein HN553_07570 [Opitutae bacterium]|nr:hypothetical protein [Opitutae bacterium]
MNASVLLRKLYVHRQINLQSRTALRPSNADPNCRKMGESQRGDEEGGFEGGWVGSFITIMIKE